MPYSDVAALVDDQFFAQRTKASYAIETLADPDADVEQWQHNHRWDMAAQPGFGDAYASAIAGGVPDPGNSPVVITDAQILGAVQAIMAAEAATS